MILLIYLVTSGVLKEDLPLQLCWLAITNIFFSRKDEILVDPINFGDLKKKSKNDAIKFYGRLKKIREKATAVSRAKLQDLLFMNTILPPS